MEAHAVRIVRMQQITCTWGDEDASLRYDAPVMSV
jgi:hypothetical protein